jgi:hypothetical protein
MSDVDDEIADMYALEILVRLYPFDRLGPIDTKWPAPIALCLKRIASRRARRSAELPQAAEFVVGVRGGLDGPVEAIACVCPFPRLACPNCGRGAGCAACAAASENR